MNNDTLKALIEAILYVSPEPVTLDMLAKALAGEEKDRIKSTLFELMNDYAWPQHGIHIRPVAGGWKFSSKAEHHEVLRSFVKSLKPPVRLTKPSLEVLAVIAYRQPITVPEINEIRGVDCGGVIHTLMERKLIVTAGRKNVIGRPILYKTSREFMLHFGLRDLGELPSLREFEEMARQALGSELLPSEALLPEAEPAVADTRGDVESGALIDAGASAAPEEASATAEGAAAANEFGIVQEPPMEDPKKDKTLETSTGSGPAENGKAAPGTESETASSGPGEPGISAGTAGVSGEK